MSYFSRMIFIFYILKASKLWNKSWQRSSQVTFINLLKFRSNVSENFSKYTWNNGVFYLPN